MPHQFDYGVSVARNSGYIDAAAQNKIRGTKLLIAGCGIGSSLALCATRMGFENFVLVDGDVVDAHNLNRQFYDFLDVGRPKVEALRDQILRVNPEAKVEAIHQFLNADNTASIVSRADIVFDTVDFLDLNAILQLHGEARHQQKHVFTALSVGFGALVWFFPKAGGASLIDILQTDIDACASTTTASPSYADVFASFIGKLAPHLDQEVVQQVSEVLSKMKEGKPCPASQVASGSFAIGALAGSMIRDLIMGRPLPASPALVIHSLSSHTASVVNVSN